MAYKPIPMVEVRVDALRLDLDNYRIPIRPDDEDAALKYLFASEDVIDQVRLFLRNDYFDNEVPIVVIEGGEHVVLEGNRRVSALKAIQEPGLVPAYEHQVRELLTRYATEAVNMPTKIRVLVAPDRAAARPHIARLHTGVSKRRWSRDQQANYYYSLLGPTMSVTDLKHAYPGVEIVRFLRMVEMRRFLDGVRFTDRSLHDYVRSAGLTMSSFEYAYRTKSIAAAMGVVFDGHALTPVTTAPRVIGANLPPAMRDAVEYMMAGFRSGRFSTRSPEFRKDSQAQATLLDILRGTADSTPLPAAAPGSQSRPEPDSEPPCPPAPTSAPVVSGSSAGPRVPNHPDTLRGLTIRGLPLDDVPANLLRRYQELPKVDVARTPAASAMLLRSVLESTIKFHFSGTPKAVTGQLRAAVQTVVDVYGSRRPHRDVLNTIASGPVARPGSANWFNAASHTPDFPITEADVRQAHSLVESVLRLLLKPYSP